jgi:hypothetical protein
MISGAKMSGKNGEQMNIADMNIAYDFDGKVMKRKNVNPDKLIDNPNKPIEYIKQEVAKGFTREPS